MSRAKKKFVKTTSELKKDFIDEIDTFLFEKADLSATDLKCAKTAALTELDRLIKQDISHGSVLSGIKSRAQEVVAMTDAGETFTEPQKSVTTSLRKSVHLIDLRKREKKEDNKAKASPKFSQRYSKVKLLFEKQNSDTGLHYPSGKQKRSIQIPSLAINGVLNRVIIFALITSLVLLPLRGLVFYGQIDSDKSQIIDYGRQGLLNLQSGVIAASENSYTRAQNDFRISLQNFEDAKAVLGEYEQWMLNVATLVPVVGKPFSLSNNLLSVATNISEAANILSEEFVTGANPTEYIVVLKSQIDKTIPYLVSANDDIEDISAIDLPPELGPYFENLRQGLPSIIENLSILSEMFTVLPSILGHETEKRYLVLFQNNNELRASGGFIGSFALFDVYQGSIVSMEIPKGGTYDLAYGQNRKIKAPQALSLINPHFNIWDANWWSDFPKSAQKVEEFYTNSTGASIDGVIAVNAEVLRQLLLASGPIKLDKYNLEISADNVYSVIQEEVELNYEDVSEPKAIISDLVPLVLEKLLKSGSEQKEMVAVLAAMIGTKDIQIYMSDRRDQEKLSKFGWTGELGSNDGDFLQVVSTNIAGGKTDLNIYQTIDHQSVISETGELINTLRITRTNKGDPNNPFAGIAGGNVSYMRAYVPLGSQFIKAVGFDRLPPDYFGVAVSDSKLDPAIEQEEVSKLIDSSSGVEMYKSLNKTVFASWMMLKPGETKTVSIKYKLPFKLDLGDPLVNNWWDNLLRSKVKLDNYSLLVQSQSGAQNTTINSSVLLPSNTRVVWSSATDSEKMNTTENLVTYSNDLVGDHYFGFIIAKD